MDASLVKAVAEGDFSTVERLISCGKVKSSAMDPSGEHILHIAANCPHGSRMIDLLAAQWPSYINVPNDDGITPLHVASMYGKLPAIQALINNGGDPFAVDSEGMTPLDYCLNDGYKDCIRYFQDLGVKPHEYEMNEEDSMAIAYASMEMTLMEDNNDSTICYTLDDASLHDDTMVEGEDLQQLTNTMLRDELIRMGEKPGPINELTRCAYLRYLHKVKSGLLPTQTKETTNFKYELALCLSGALPVPDFSQIEKELFSNSNSTTGNTRNCFNYLLLDPRVTQQLTAKVGELQRFRVFIEAVFYIGKGQKDRPLQHLLDAKVSQLVAPNKDRSTKLQRILDVWNDSKGIISLHCFHSALSAEAFTREACMVEAVGLPNLTNIRRGQYGLCHQWSIQKKRQYGIYLLYKAYNIFSIEGEQQIFPYNL